LEQLAAEHAWDLLREQATRHAEAKDAAIAIPAKRLLALSLAHSVDGADRDSAVAIYRALVADGTADRRDHGNLATLLIDSGRLDEARVAVLDGMERFPGEERDYFVSIGLRIVEATGDRAFREALMTTTAAKRRV
jgi:hypothetical protein